MSALLASRAMERQQTFNSSVPTTGTVPALVGAGSNSDDGLNVNTEIFKGRDIPRSDTPETLLTAFSNRPDITILCDRCCIYIDIRNLLYHRAYHDALTTLNYRHPQKPTDVRTLLQRRNIILKKMKGDSSRERPLQPKDVRKVDEAYELLKSDLEDVYEEVKQINQKLDFHVNGVALNCSPECAQAVGMCSNENKRWKSYMEDVKVYQDYFGEDRNKCYLAIFDGYHGAQAAERSGNEFHHLLLHEMAKFDSKTKSTTARNFAESSAARLDYEQLRPETRDSLRTNMHQDSTEIIQNIMDMCYEKYDNMMKDKNETEEKKEKKKKSKHPLSDKMHKAFKKTYLLMDILLSYGKDEMSKVRWSGTSSTTVVIQNTKSKKEEDDKLSALEEETSGSEGQRNSGKKPNGLVEPEELGLIHIANAGNSKALLVRDNKPYCLTKDHSPKNPKERDRILQAGGDLSNSEKDCRVNGVLSVTRGLGNHGDKKLKDCVIVDPHVTTVPIDQYAQFLVLGSNGLWEVFSDAEIASLLVKMLPDQHIPPPSRFSESLFPLLQQVEKDTAAKSANNTEKLPADSQLDQQQQSKRPGTSQREERVTFLEDNVKPESRGSQKDTGSNSQKKEQRAETPRKETNTLVVHGNDSSNTKSVLVDMHTEIGSRHGETDEDGSLHPGKHHGLDDDYLELQEHSNIHNSGPPTEDELRRELAKSMSEQMTQAALLAGAKDNITVMIVLLPGCKIDTM